MDSSMEREASSTSLEDYKSRLDQLRNDKGRLSRLVGEARKSGSGADGLVSELQDVSVEIKKLQKLVKKQLNDTPANNKWMPPAIVPPPAILDKPHHGFLSVKPCDAELSSAADDYVAGHPGASLWHRPSISSFVEKVYGHQTRYLCAIDHNTELVGALPIVQLKSRLFGNFMVSMPYFNYGGILADNSEVARALVAAANQWRQQEASEHLELRFLQDSELGLPQKTDKVTFWLPLPERCEDLWGSFKPKLRAQIRRGERELTEFSIGGGELLDEFYRVFSINMRDLGTPVYSRTFFGSLLEHLKGQAWLVIVRINGQAAGCAFLTGYRDRMEIPWASTLRQHSHTGINMIMYWKILEFAIERGFSIFDFGRCTEKAGTYRFKQQWGAQAIDLYWDYILETGKSLPALNPGNPKFRLLIAAWQRLPLWLANLLGPRIVKVLP